MKYCPGGSIFIMKSTPRVPGGIQLMAIGYKYNYRKVLGFISTKGYRSTEPGDPYLSCYPDIYSNIYVFPVVSPHLLVRYFNACNAIENHNRMRKTDTALDQYWVTHSGYFRLATTLALGMGIIYVKILFCHGISQESEGGNISMGDYKNRTVYDFFDNIFPDYFGSLELNLPPITIDDRPRLHKISRHTLDLLPVDISVASENSLSTFTTLSDSIRLFLLPLNYNNPLRAIMKDEP